jgi:N6-adenosine-specific RNA methylase IME4
VERERVARRLRHQQRELETHRYKLQQLKKLRQRGVEDGDRGVKHLQSAMKEERRKIEHHKERARHLASRMKKLDRRARHRDDVRKGWELVKDRLSLSARR